MGRVTDQKMKINRSRMARTSYVQQEGGYTLIMVLGTISVVSLIVGAVLFTNRADMTSTSRDLTLQQAYYLASAGAEEAYAVLKNSGGQPHNGGQSLNTGSYSYTMQSSGPNQLTVTAVGCPKVSNPAQCTTATQPSKTVTEVIQLTSPVAGRFNGMTGNHTQTIEPMTINGNVYTNGDTDLDSSLLLTAVTVNGNVTSTGKMVPTGGLLSYPRISGTVTNNAPPQPFPSVNPCSYLASATEVYPSSTTAGSCGSGTYQQHYPPGTYTRWNDGKDHIVLVDGDIHFDNLPLLALFSTTIYGRVTFVATGNIYIDSAIYYGDSNTCLGFIAGKNIYFDTPVSVSTNLNLSYHGLFYAGNTAYENDLLTVTVNVTQTIVGGLFYNYWYDNRVLNKILNLLPFTFQADSNLNNVQPPGMSFLQPTIVLWKAN
jgi:hypothetical protein